MEYILWAVVGLLAYSFVAPLASDVTQEVPPLAAVFLSTTLFLGITATVIAVAGTGDTAHVLTVEAGYVYVAGVFLTIGILAYIAALETGPVSVVVPIYGMFIVGSSVLGIVFLGERVTAPRIAGIVCAMVAIYLCSEGE